MRLRGGCLLFSLFAPLPRGGLLPPLPFRLVVDDPAGLQVVEAGQLLRRQFIEQGRLSVVEQGDAPLRFQPQHLIVLHEVPLGVALGLGVGAGGAVNRGEQGLQGHLVVGDGDGDFAALFRDVLGGGQVVAAHIEGHVKGVKLVFPVLAWIFFCPLAQALHHNLAGHIKAPDAVEHIGDAFHVSDVAELIQAEVDHHRQPPVFPVEPGIVGEARKGQGEEQGAQKAVGAVLG